MLFFYSNYVLWLKSNIKYLRRSTSLSSLKLITLCLVVFVDWFIRKLLTIFVITSPLLLRYNSSKPTFLKTYWSAGSMAYIHMKHTNSPESLSAVRNLQSTSELLSIVLILSFVICLPSLILALTLTTIYIIIRLLVIWLVVTRISHNYANICGDIVLLTMWFQYH